MGSKVITWHQQWLHKLASLVPVHWVVPEEDHLCICMNMLYCLDALNGMSEWAFGIVR